jgi:hypothetical protein
MREEVANHFGLRGQVRRDTAFARFQCLSLRAQLPQFLRRDFPKIKHQRVQRLPMCWRCHHATLPRPQPAKVAPLAVRPSPLRPVRRNLSARPPTPPRPPAPRRAPGCPQIPRLRQPRPRLRPRPLRPLSPRIPSGFLLQKPLVLPHLPLSGWRLETGVRRRKSSTSDRSIRPTSSLQSQVYSLCAPTRASPNTSAPPFLPRPHRGRGQG